MASLKNRGGSKEACHCRPHRFHQLKAPGILMSVWLLIVVITLLHYASPSSAAWAHDVLRRAYYIPIVIAAMRCGLGGGLIVAAAVSVLYIPHAFFHHLHFDPARGLEKSLEMVLYFVVASVAGHLSDLECRRRHQLEKAIETQKSLTNQLARAGRLAALGEVVAGIAHEIKNPLHALAGTAEIVDPEIDKESEVRPMWEIHKSEIDRLKRVAEKFLSFARPDPIELTRLDLNDVATRLSDLVAAQTRQKHVAFDLRIPDEAIHVYGDMDQLAQVALNLTVNAINAIGESGGRIWVTVGKETVHQKKMGVMRIENDGPTIPVDDRERLFDPFHSGGEGTGLGLSISNRIIHQHDGFFELTEGELGVAFAFYLPMAD